MPAVIPVGAVSMEEELVRGVWRHQLVEIHHRKPDLSRETLQIVDKVRLTGDRGYFKCVTILPGGRRNDHHCHGKVMPCREGLHPSKCLVQPRSVRMVQDV